MANLSLDTGTYRFCIDGTDTALKINIATPADGRISQAARAGTLVKTSDLDGFRTELWRWESSKLYTEYGLTLGARCLSKNSSGNAQVSTTSTTVTLEQVSSGTYAGKKCKIKIGKDYLVKSSNDSACTFSTSSSKGTVFTVEPIRKMWSMPTDLNYPQRVEFFHPDAFPEDAAWIQHNTDRCGNFYNRIFKTSYNIKKSMHNLYGALMSSGIHKGMFHQGVDLYNNTGSKVYTNHSGVIEVDGVNGGQVMFTGLSPKRIYLHMTPVVTSSTGDDDRISAGTQIGTQNATWGHVHFEVNEQGRAQMPVKDSNDPLGTISPYDYMV